MPAASSMERPSEIAFQKGHRAERCSTAGLPGEHSFARSDRSPINFFELINTHPKGVLRRLVELTQYAAKDYRKTLLAARGVTVSISRKDDCRDSAPMESVNGTVNSSGGCSTSSNPAESLTLLSTGLMEARSPGSPNKELPTKLPARDARSHPCGGTRARRGTGNLELQGLRAVAQWGAPDARAADGEPGGVPCGMISNNRCAAPQERPQGGARLGPMWSLAPFRVDVPPA